MTDTTVRASYAPARFVVPSGSSSANFTLPSGLAVGDPLRIFVSSDSTKAIGGTVTPPAGWTLALAQVDIGTASCFILERTGGYQSGDGSSVTVTMSGVTMDIRFAYVALAMKGNIYSGWGTPSPFNLRTGTVATTTALAAGDSGDEVIVAFFVKMSGNDGNPAVSGGAQLIAHVDLSGSAVNGVWLGSYTGPGVDQTITYSGTSGNGGGIQIPMVKQEVIEPTEPKVRGVIVGGVEVAASIRGVMVGGTEVLGTVKSVI